MGSRRAAWRAGQTPKIDADGEAEQDGRDDGQRG